VATGTGILTF